MHPGRPGHCGVQMSNLGDLVPDPAASPPQTVRVLNIANALTVLRLVLVPVFVVALFQHGGEDTTWRVTACVVFAIAAVTDRIDGDLARKHGLITDFGKLADPIADKALTGAALISLSVLDRLTWWVTVLILGREIGVTLLRFWVIRHGIMPASRGGKIKTTAQALAIGLYLLPLSGWLWVAAQAVMGLALALTLVTGADYVARAVTLRRVSLAARLPEKDAA